MITTGKQLAKTDKLVERVEKAGLKKKAPHWMVCNCLCHGTYGTWGKDPEKIRESCPHCKPEKYPNYEVEEAQK